MKKMLYLCYLFILHAGATFCMEKKVPFAIKSYKKPGSKVKQLMPPSTQTSSKSGNNRQKKTSNVTKQRALLKKREKEPEKVQEKLENEVVERTEQEEEEYEWGSNSLIKAIRKENLDQIRDCLNQKFVDINRVNSEGKTPLICAIFTGNYTIVEYLLESGAQPDPQNSNPQQIAQFMQNKPIINLLAQKRTSEYTHISVQDMRKKHRCDCEACSQALAAENDLFFSSCPSSLFELDMGMTPQEVFAEREYIKQQQFAQPELRKQRLMEAAIKSKQAAKNRKEKGYEPVIGVDDTNDWAQQRTMNSSPDEAPKFSILDLFDRLMSKKLSE